MATTTTAGALLFLTVGVLCLILPVLGAGVFFPTKRKWAIRLVVGDIVLAVCCVSAFLAIRPLHLDARDIPALKSQGAAIIEALDAYERNHGRYPEALSVLTGILIETRYGAWHYRVEEGGRKCAIWVGDYGRNLFELSWDSDKKSWYLDA